MTLRDKIENLSDSDYYELWETFCDCYHYDEDRVYYNDEEIICILLQGKNPWDMLTVDHESYNQCDKFVRYDSINERLMSSDSIRDLADIDDLLAFLESNPGFIPEND